MRLHRWAVASVFCLVGALCVPSIAPAQRLEPGERIAGEFVDMDGSLDAETIGGLERAYEAAGLGMSGEAFEEIKQTYVENPRAEIVLFNHGTGASAAADLEGRYAFEVVPLECASRGCARFAERHEGAVGLALHELDGAVAVVDGGKVGFALFDGARSMSALDPETGEMYVEWPVVFGPLDRELFPDSTFRELFPDSIFEEAVRTVFRGVGRFDGERFLAVDVTRIEGEDGSAMDVINKNGGG